MKKWFKTLLCFAFAFSLLCSGMQAYAKEGKGKSVEIEEHMSVLTKEEAIQLVMEKEGISYSEASARFSENLLASDGMLRSSTSYPTYTKVYKYPSGAKIEIGGMWELYVNGSFRQLNRLKSKWTKAVGSGSYTWNQSHVTDITGRYPATTVSLRGRGVIEIAVSVTNGAGVGAELQGMGFSVSSSTSTTKYYCKTVDLNLSKSIY